MNRHRRTPPNTWETRSSGNAGSGHGPHPLTIGILAVLVMAGVLWLTAQGLGKGLSSFVAAGTEFVTDPAAVPDELELFDEVGYDGQQYYRLSRAPFSTAETVDGIPLDSGPYRQRRIVYPLLAWALSGLTGLSTLLTLPAVNLLAVGAVGRMVAGWARRHGRTTWWGLLTALMPVFYFGTTRNLAEPLALALVVAGLFAWQRRPWVGAVVMSLAVLTRETTIVVPAAVGIVALIDGMRRRSWQPVWRRAVPALLPLVTLVAWMQWLAQRWAPTSADAELAESALSGRSFGIPIVAPLRHTFRLDWTGGFTVEHFWSIEHLFVLVALVIAGSLAWRHREISPDVRVAFALATVVAVSFGWAWAASFTRIVGEAIVLGALVALSAGARGRFYFYPILLVMAMVPITQ